VTWPSPAAPCGARAAPPPASAPVPRSGPARGRIQQQLQRAAARAARSGAASSAGDAVLDEGRRPRRDLVARFACRSRPACGGRSGRPRCSRPRPSRPPRRLRPGP
jgi:hypothetical protein